MRLQDHLKKPLLAFLAILGITSGGTYLAVDSFTNPGPGSHVLTIFPLTAWSPCSQPPYRPNIVPEMQEALAQGEAIAGYWLIAPPISYGLSNTPAGRMEAGVRSAERARYGDPNNPSDDIPADLWDALLFAASDTEVPGVCSPTYDLHADTVQAATDRMREMKCLANVDDGVCAQVGYTNANEWLHRVKPYGEKPYPPDFVWVADWDGDPNLGNWIAFGGKTTEEVLIKQYSGGTLYQGVTVDLNAIQVDPSIFVNVTPTPTPEPTSTPPPITAVPRDPPDYSSGCWLGWFAASWFGRWNTCSNVWVGTTGRFYDPGLNQWYYQNGVPVP